MFCSNCGGQIKPGYMFCENCGARVEQPLQQQPLQQQPLQQQPLQQQTLQQKPKYKKKYNFGNILLWPACIAVAVSVFLPYAQVNVSSNPEYANLIRTDGNWGDGVIVLFLALFVFILDLLKLNIGNVLCSAIMVGFSVFELISVYLSGVKEYVTFGVGCKVFMIGAVVMLFASIIGFLIASSSKKKFKAKNNQG